MPLPHHTSRLAPLFASAFLLLACGGDSADSSTGSATPSTGGTSQGGQTQGQGGKASSQGGSSAGSAQGGSGQGKGGSPQAGASQGGSSQGGAGDAGGNSSAGNSSGGTSQGGSPQGGTSQGGAAQAGAGGEAQAGAAQGGSAQAGAAQGGSAQGGSAQGGATSSTPLPCELDSFVQARCQQCHSDPPKFGAPMPLVTWEDLTAPSKSDPATDVAHMMLARLQDETAPMPQPPNPPATPEEIALVQAFLDAGMPAGDGMCGGEGGAGGAGGSAQGGSSQGGAGGGASVCTGSQELVPKQKYQMPESTEDQYICYGFTVPAGADKRHITRIAPRIDNSTIVHHMLVFLADGPQPEAPTPCPAFPSQSWKLYYAWAPGAPAFDLPPEAGLPIDPGSDAHFAIQVHYSNLNHLVGEQDGTGVDLCTTTELRPNDADIMALGSLDFSLPPHAKTTLDCKLKIEPAYGPVMPIHVFQAWPHMHLLGSAMNNYITHADGSTSDLGDVPAYSFYNQITYPVDTQLDVGDTVTTACTWKNDGDSPVPFGESTSSEMCFNFITYYPRINVPGWNWLAPSYFSSCQYK